ncbi:MAG: hypothetical protein CMH57_06640, partial [Myxococcales bacterium]|nr:hypothetical protein [Myxococcales bacterium]
QAEQGAQPGNVNNFQGRYIIRHAWTGPIACQNPVRGRWGGPPAGKSNPGPVAAEDLGMVKRGGVRLANLTLQDIPALKMKADVDMADIMTGKKTMPSYVPSKEPIQETPQAPPTDKAPKGDAPADDKPAAPGGEAPAPSPEAAEEGCAAAPGAPGSGLTLLALLLAVGIVRASRRP